MWLVGDDDDDDDDFDGGHGFTRHATHPLKKIKNIHTLAGYFHEKCLPQRKSAKRYETRRDSTFKDPFP